MQRGLHRSPHFGASVEFAEYREYTPGDPIGLIDWSVYARTNRYVIRRFLEETNLRAYLLLDTSESLAFQDTGPMTKMDFACYLAAGLLYLLVNQGDSAAFSTFDRQQRSAFEPIGTREGLRPLLLHLESIRPNGRGDIEAAIHEAANRARARSLFIIISDFLQDAAAIVNGLRHLHHDGHSIIALHVLDHGERELGFSGIAELRELETGRRLVIDVENVRTAYAAAVGRHIDELRAGCAECMADYHLLDTRLPVVEALNRLRERGRA